MREAACFWCRFLSVGSNSIRGDLDLAQALPYLVGGAAGGFLSGRVFRRVNMLWLRRAFGLLILYGGVRSLLLL